MNIQELQNLSLTEMPMGESNRYEANRKLSNMPTPTEPLGLVLSKLQPMGIRVIVDVPLTLPPGRPLFAIRVTPTWLHPLEALAIDPKADLNRINLDLPVVVPMFVGDDGVAEGSEPRVRVAYYNTP